MNENLHPSNGSFYLSSASIKQAMNALEAIRDLSALHVDIKTNFTLSIASTLKHIVQGCFMFFDRPFSRSDIALLDSFEFDFLVFGPKQDATLRYGSLVQVSEPRVAFSTLVERLYGYDSSYHLPKIQATIDLGGIDDTATVGGNVLIGENCTIGPGSVIYPNVSIGPNVTIGSGVTVKSGCVIGQCGFGAFRDEQGKTKHFPHIGGVVIEDGVELGAINNIASGTIFPTVIGRSVASADLVQFAHNVIVGSDTFVATCASISGSARLGKRCFVGAQSSISNGVSVGDDCFIGIGTNVIRDTEPKTRLVGNPARILPDGR